MTTRLKIIDRVKARFRRDSPIEVLLDATSMNRAGAGLARFQREVAPRLSRALRTVTVVKTIAIRDGSASAIEGRLIAVPDVVPAIVVEQVVVPCVAWWCRPTLIHSLSGHLPLIATPGRRVLSYLEDRTEYHRAYPAVGFYARTSVWVQNLIERRSLRTADVIVAISEYAASLARAAAGVRRAHETSIVVAYLGVSQSFRAMTADEEGTFGNYVVTLSSGDPRDGLDWIFQSVGFMATPVPIVVVGKLTPEVRVGVAEMAARWDVAVETPGYLQDEEVAELHRNALAYVQGSQYEGFGLGVVEAMACGAPVVARRSNALLEVGGSGVAVADTPEEASRILSDLSSSPDRRLAMGRASTSSAAIFDWDTTAASIISAYGAAQESTNAPL
jgi:glycosyltransferase involved in cell wall biosynthesis